MGRDTFRSRLAATRKANQSLLCVGLDPELDRLPTGFVRNANGVLAFTCEIVDATIDLVCAYKPNLAFYESLGSGGWRALEHLLAHIGGRVPVIADAKRGDIGNTARAYARTVYDGLGVDAVTVSPYLGLDSVEPFLTRPDRCALILCRTSNPGAGDFQDLYVGDRPLYLAVAERVQQWDRQFGTCGLVVGATYPEELARIREVAPYLPILVPGIGAQGGDPGSAVLASRAATTAVVISSSRGILFASSSADFAAAARTAAEHTRTELNAALAQTESDVSTPLRSTGP